MDIQVIILFSIITIGTLLITYFASKKTKTAGSFYTAGGGLTARQNGLALAGDFMSASTFLGLIGAFALSGFDGFFLMYPALLSFLVILFLVAEPLRNLGKYTLGDMITARYRFKQVRAVTAINTIVISIFYMLGQLVAAGALFKLLLGIPFHISIIIVGIGMLTFVLFGGMTATSWVQIIKAILLVGGTFILFIMVMWQFSFNFIGMFAEMKTATPVGADFLNPGVKYLSGLDAASLVLGLLLGAAGLPHILVRFLTVPNAQVARKSVVWVMWIMGCFHFMVIFLGFGAAKLVGMPSIIEANPAGNMAAPLLAQLVGGDLMFAFISAVSFATILAVVAGIVVTGAAAFSHDLYNEIFKNGQATEKQQMNMVRLASIVITAVSIVLSLSLQSFNVAFLASLAFTLAASSNLPVILFTVFWRKFNKTGAVFGMLVGLLGTLTLVALSPNVWNPVPGAALLTGEAIFPLSSPGIVSIPLGFLACYIGTKIGAKKAALEEDRYTEILVKSHTGSDVKGVIKH
ncbi:MULTISPECIES: solute symporter family protein [Cytobacillus]|uniref:solute symporter family protein n=1 Tax=Cytobacillus TaxID=2675230 RepID=UPI00203AAB26|nr:cation acetate symporter [Cytobacillus kochii]MCM3322613.1 cation acetate symporter [Cytobacillus kochii]MCM3344908.1 cation acetate symporter [Cytobacillus kochii]